VTQKTNATSVVVPESSGPPITRWRSATFGDGWYCDALPTGEYVVLFPNQKYLRTHKGVLEFAGNSPTNRTTTYAPLFPRITNVGGFKIAGQAWDADATVEYVDGAWNMLPPAVGVLPVIYDNYGILYISDGAYPGPGSQGYVYVDFYTGDIVFGDATYSVGPSIGIPLYQYTDLGDGNYVGQGSISLNGDPTNTGAIYWNSNTRDYRLIEPGFCRFIRSHRSADNRISVAIWKDIDSRGATESVLKFGTLDGFLDLPTVS
jgi:hypothetical protein